MNGAGWPEEQLPAERVCGTSDTAWIPHFLNPPSHRVSWLLVPDPYVRAGLSLAFENHLDFSVVPAMHLPVSWRQRERLMLGLEVGRGLSGVGVLGLFPGLPFLAVS